jgi:putative peptidoglycan lipid II flippase
VPILSAKDVDPYGSNEENSAEAPQAFDGDPATAWHTVVYRRADMSGKPGVGIMFDLGSPRQVSSVQLSLVGSGSDVTVAASNDPTVAPEKFQVLAQATAAGSDLRLRLPKSISTQYLLVWFTQLPSSPSGGYQGGISEIKILG